MDTNYTNFYPPPPPRHRAVRPWVIGVIVAVCILFVLFIAVAIAAGGESTSAPSEEHVGVLHINGTIASTTDTALLYASGAVYSQQYVLDSIEEMRTNPLNKGILLYIDTPGGEMYASDEVLSALLAYKEETGRPIYAYFASTAASGGYYIAMAADEIYAHRMTLTGSIGVTYGTHIDLSELCERLGVKVEDITSGDNKAMGSYFAPLTDEQREIYQSQLAEYEQYFIDAIVTGRSLEEDAVKEIADGRTYTAKQALELKLIDGISEYAAYQSKVAESLGGNVSFHDYVFEMDYEELLASIGYQSESGAPASEIESVLAAIKPLSGPLMYYSGN